MKWKFHSQSTHCCYYYNEQMRFWEVPKKQMMRIHVALVRWYICICAYAKHSVIKNRSVK